MHGSSSRNTKQTVVDDVPLSVAINKDEESKRQKKLDFDLSITQSNRIVNCASSRLMSS